MRTMTMRERMLAVMQGRPHDRMPFVQYDNMPASSEEIWQLLGRNNPGIWRWSAVHRLEYPNCRISTQRFQRGGLRGKRRILHTPAGTLTEEILCDRSYNSPHIVKHFVKEPEDYRILVFYLQDRVVRADLGPYLRDLRELGDDGWPLPAVSCTPFQQLWIQWVSLDNLCFHLSENVPPARWRISFPETVRAIHEFGAL